MKKYTYSLLLAFMFVFSGCTEDDFCNCLQRTGATETESRAASAFSKIELNNNVDLEVLQDTACSIKVTCGENLIDGISTEVVSGKLIIRNNNKCNWLRDLNNKFTVTVTVKDLDYILTQGSGNINFVDTLRNSPFLIESYNGTGDYRLLFSSSRAELKLHSGPADIYVSGYVADIFIYSAANGFVHGEHLRADLCSISTYSTGDTRVGPSNTLNANIGYSGDVYYTGQPVITRTGDGTGQLLPY